MLNFKQDNQEMIYLCQFVTNNYNGIFFELF